MRKTTSLKNKIKGFKQKLQSSKDAQRRSRRRPVLVSNSKKRSSSTGESGRNLQKKTF